MNDVVDIALKVGSSLDEAQVAYFLGGSLASSIQGEPRSTNDIDFVVDLSAAQVTALSQALGTDFDVDEESLREAAIARSSWNIFFLPLAVKIDLFILRDGAFDREEFARRRRVNLGGASLYVKSPEDTVLRKLLWFREGGEVSTTQWRDVVRVLAVSGAQMDPEYLARWSRHLGLVSLLDRAQSEAGAATGG
ncbi:MAG: hypothetical protein M3Y59_24685 [Myxococcota bacterium]|nr:hypothetical protein [Myxococcota bacterium]